MKGKNGNTDGCGMKGVRRHIRLMVAVFALACIFLSMSGPTSDGGTEGTTYGSNQDPYGGLYADWDSLEDGGTYYLAKGSHVSISCPGAELTRLGEKIAISGLTVDNENGLIEGELGSSTILEMDCKVVVLMISNNIYGDLPIYGSNAWSSEPVEVIAGTAVSLEGPRTSKQASLGLTLTGAPAGLTVAIKSDDTSTYVISGTPEIDSAGTYNFTIKDRWIRGYYYTEGTIEVYNVINLHADVALEYDKILFRTNYVKDGLKIPTPEKYGYRFLGWFTEPVNGEDKGLGGDPLKICEGRTNYDLYARFEEANNPISRIDFAVDSLTIGLNDGKVKVEAVATLTNTDLPGDRHVDFDILIGEDTVISRVGGTTYSDTGGYIEINPVAIGTAKIQAIAKDGSGVTKELTVVVSESASTTTHSFYLEYDANTDGNVTNMPLDVSFTGSGNTYNTAISGKTPYHPSKTFLYWINEDNNETYKPSATISLIYSQPTTLKAVWSEKNSFTLLFNPNGGSGGPSSITEYDTDTTHRFVSLPGSQYNPVKDGYTFMGWGTTSTSTTASCQPGGQYLAKTVGETELFAIWKEDTGTTDPAIVLFHPNGGYGGPTDIRQTEGPPFVISIGTEKPNRSGYTFNGWSKQIDGSKDYDAGSEYIFPSGTTILYAVWVKNSYTVTFDANNGSDAPESIITDGTFTIPADKVPKRTGYRFMGWSDEQSATDVNMSFALGKSVTIGDSLTLHAIWRSSSGTVEYTVHYYGFENIAVGSSSVSSGEEPSVKVTSTKPTSDNMYFMGWSDVEGSDVAVYQAGDTIVPKATSVYLYPVWSLSANAWTLTFHHNGGYGPLPTVEPVSVDGTSHVFTFSDIRPIRDGYEFLGWDNEPNAIEPSIKRGTTQYTAESQNSNLYAIWKEGEKTGFLLKFNLEGGSGNFGDLSGEAVVTMYFKLPKEAPTKEGYVFDGWVDEYDPDTVYGPGETYETTLAETTLHAKYVKVGESNVFQLTYVFYTGCEYVDENRSTTSSCAFKLMEEGDENFVQRDGYMFLGWSKSEGGAVIEGGYHTAENTKERLYAIWKPTSVGAPDAKIDVRIDGYNVTFDASKSVNGVTFSWNFGDQFTGQGKVIQHEYKTAGTYKVTLTVHSSSNMESTIEKEVTVPGTTSNTSIVATVVGIVAILALAVIAVRFLGVM